MNLLHCADLHLDSPFSGLQPEQAAARRGEQRQLPRRIVELGRKLGCELILCSGDVFDGERVRPETVEALREVLEDCPVPVFIAPGNHDPYTAQSPWARVSWPSQVHIFKGGQESVTLEHLGCRVWGAGFTGPESYEGLQPVAGSGLLELGVFHAGPTTPGPYRYLTREEIGASGLAYLALGHIHKPQLPLKIGGTWVGWPGIPMGRGFDETGVHGVFQVRVTGEDCRAVLHPMDSLRYEKRTVRAGTALELPEEAARWICRLTITGEAEPFDPEALRQRLQDRFYALEIRDETVPPPDIWSGCGEDTLRGLALQRLKAQYDQAGEQERETIALAARYVLAALEGREEP